ncbi:hypothetical protein [Pseudomonas juntendi]|uniref:hypothetical protein n=1 Tax=Pseudomonas juntendi TaxID=2666183 RepID=UPI003207C32A
MNNMHARANTIPMITGINSRVHSNKARNHSRIQLRIQTPYSEFFLHKLIEFKANFRDYQQPLGSERLDERDYHSYQLHSQSGEVSTDILAVMDAARSPENTPDGYKLFSVTDRDAAKVMRP